MMDCMLPICNILNIYFLAHPRDIKGLSAFIYTWIFENRVSKIATHSFTRQLKTVKLIQIPIKSVYLTPGSKLMIPRSIPTSPNLKWRSLEAEEVGQQFAKDHGQIINSLAVTTKPSTKTDLRDARLFADFSHNCARIPNIS